MSLETYFAAYQSYHHDRRNKLCHYLGIPLIVYALLNFLYQIPAVPLRDFRLDWALVFVVAVLVFYATLSVRLAVAMAVLTAPAYLLAAFTPWLAGVGAFVVGWILQLVGHRYEGRKPAFLSNAVHLLIGPLWIAGHLLERLGLWAPRPLPTAEQALAAGK